jgi:hypothetical protein
MQFIEMSGKTLLRLAHLDGLDPAELRSAGVTEESVVRVNRQGDLELRKHDCWDVIGGLLGDFDAQLRKETGLSWA